MWPGRRRHGTAASPGVQVCVRRPPGRELCTVASVIFFDDECATVDESAASRGWRYAATNGAVFFVLVVLTAIALVLFAAHVVYGRVILGWTLVVADAVRDAL